MYKLILILVFCIIGTGTGFSQFFKFEDMTALLEVANEREEAEKFLRDKGYKLENEENEDEDKYSIEYRKIIGEEEYIIYVIGDTDLDVYTASVFSWNPAVWDYYFHYFHANEYELVNTDKKKGGVFIYDFEGDDYDVSMGTYPQKDGTTLYKIIISYY